MRFALISVEKIKRDWVDDLPYSDGGEAIGESPIIWHVEFYVTPFDELIWDDQEGSVISELEAGKVIEFFLTMADGDTDTPRGVAYDVDDAFLSGAGNPSVNADFLVDGLLLGAGGDMPDDSAVRADSWGRIKAGQESVIHHTGDVADPQVA